MRFQQAAIALALMLGAALPAQAEAWDYSFEGAFMGQPKGGAGSLGLEYTADVHDLLTFGLGAHVGGHLNKDTWSALAYGGPHVGLSLPFGEARLEPSVMLGLAYTSAAGPGGGFNPLLAPRLKLDMGGGGFAIGVLTGTSRSDAATDPAPGISGWVFSFFFRD